MIDHADAVEAAALADLVTRAPREVADALGITVERHGGALAVRCPAPISLFNRVIGIGTLAPPDPALIDDAVARARAHGAPMIWIHVASTAPPTLIDALVERGFRKAKRAAWAKMARGTAPPPVIPCDLRVEEVGLDRAADVGRVLAEAFAPPPPMTALLVTPVGRRAWRTFAALDGDDVVGCGMAFVDGDAAWLGMGGTLRSHRCRGAQGALMARRIGEAIAAGCRWIVTETGEPIADEPNPSLGNMLRCGFTQIDSRANWELTL